MQGFLTREAGRDWVLAQYGLWQAVFINSIVCDPLFMADTLFLKLSRYCIPLWVRIKLNM